MAKILLIKPLWPYPYSKGEYTYNRIWPPLSLANCAAILEKQGDKVEILDAHALRIKPEDIKDFIVGFDKVFITSSSLDRWQCPNINIGPFLEAVRSVRETNSECYVMGYHGTVDPGDILRKTQAKAVIRGEPELTVADICQGKLLNEIRGLSYSDEGEVVSNADRDDVDLTCLPTPTFHLLDTRKYFYEILGKDFALFEIGRGCQFACEFCNKIMYGARLRTKSKDQVCEDLRVAIEECGVRTGYFIDLEFLADKDIVREICEFLIEKKYEFRWCCQTRPSSVDSELLRLMKQAGCRLVHFGIESGLQKFLDLSKKGIKLEKMFEAVKTCEDQGMKTLAFYVFGFQDETIEDRRETFEFAKKLNTDYTSFHKIYPYKTSGVYLQNLTSEKEIDKFIRKIFVRYYIRAGYLKKLNLLTALKAARVFFGRFLSL